MNTITRFEITNLHGCKNVRLRLVDNTLILVGENGAGKTTVLNLLYYLLSGQWSSMAKYQFEEITIRIGGKDHKLRFADLEKSLLSIDKRLFRSLPPSVRHKITMLLEQAQGRLVPMELERLCHEYGIPFEYLLEEIGPGLKGLGRSREQLQGLLGEIRTALSSQLLFLPTYRRIEQELNLIFKGLDERELKQRRDLLNARRSEETFVELVEFGMKDVESAVSSTLSQLSTFARDSLNNLTFGYLGDIVEEQYAKVDLTGIKRADDQTISNILDRIQEHILSSENKSHLRDIINRVKRNQPQTEHTKVICHYFTKLMAFQKDLETKEAQIRAFCKVCNEYLTDKEFRYDFSQFTFSIQRTGFAKDSGEIKLHQLSSGEKQIVSLFSHLYLSGERNYFVLIDEPELSLSVPWQRRFLPDIRNADFCTGLVAVTHSPFIYENNLRKYAHGLGEFAS